MLPLIFFSGTVCVAAEILSDLEFSAGVLELSVLGFADLESAEIFLGSEFVVFTESEALGVLAFFAFLEDWATSSVISTILGLVYFLGLEGLEFCLFSFGRICKNFVFGVSTFFLFLFWEFLLVEDSLFFLFLRLY